MGEPLLCKECHEGTLVWGSEETEDMGFDESMARDLICNECGHVYKGMDDFIWGPDGPPQTQQKRTPEMDSKTTVEHFAPGVKLPDGRVVYPTGFEWLLAFAIRGCDWAVNALDEAMANHQRAQENNQFGAAFPKEAVRNGLVRLSSVEFCTGCLYFNEGGQDGDDFRCGRYRGLFGKQSREHFAEQLLPSNCIRQGQIHIAIAASGADAAEIDQVLHRLGLGAKPPRSIPKERIHVLESIMEAHPHMKISVTHSGYDILVQCSLDRGARSW